ncbi:MAG: dTDP-4-dehydrorhamnose reductase [Candidatus Melainabacteria bacterium]|nr:dTDP-4-dehydrorhamnose reductase [Candidatus Melainabacteria bacterium]
MKHLVVGASGQIGGAIYKSLVEKNQDVLGTYYTQPARGMRKLDINERSRVFKLVKEVSPDVIYACAGLTNVDRCEGDAKESFKVNVVGAANLVEAANRVGAKLVLLSSDYIFDGDRGPYDVNDLANPLNVYGYHKLLMEQHVATVCESYLIVRTTIVYGWEVVGKNFIARLIHKLSQRQKIKVPNDQFGTPTYNRNLARTLIELVGRDQSGVFHLAGSTSIDRYGFAIKAAQIFGLDTRLIQACPTAELKQKARRPLKAGLKLDKTRDILTTKLLGYEEGLRQMLKDNL